MRFTPALAILVLISAAAPALARDVSFTLRVGTNSAGGNMYARPAQINVSAGDRVTLTVINDDTNPNGSVRVPHDIAVDAVDMPRTGGSCAAVTNPPAPDEGEFEVCDRSQATGTFTPSAGNHTYQCEVPGHAAAGMGGVFVVQSASAPTPTPTKRTPGFEGIAAVLALGLLARRRS